jgi:hypothetical protein
MSKESAFRFVRISPIGLVATDMVITPDWFQVPEKLPVFRDLVSFQESGELRVLHECRYRNSRTVEAILTDFPYFRLWYSEWDGNGVLTVIAHSVLACTHYLTGKNRQQEAKRINVTLQGLGMDQNESGTPSFSMFRGDLPEVRPVAISVVFSPMAGASDEQRAYCQCCEIYTAAAYFERTCNHEYA